MSATGDLSQKHQPEVDSTERDRPHHDRKPILKALPNDNPVTGLPGDIRNHDVGTRADDHAVTT